jgi:hypothetical protein
MSILQLIIVAFLTGVSSAAQLPRDPNDDTVRPTTVPFDSGPIVSSNGKGFYRITLREVRSQPYDANYLREPYYEERLKFGSRPLRLTLFVQEDDKQHEREVWSRDFFAGGIGGTPLVLLDVREVGKNVYLVVYNRLDSLYAIVIDERIAGRTPLVGRWVDVEQFADDSGKKYRVYLERDELMRASLPHLLRILSGHVRVTGSFDTGDLILQISDSAQTKRAIFALEPNGTSLSWKQLEPKLMWAGVIPPGNRGREGESEPTNNPSTQPATRPN